MKRNEYESNYLAEGLEQLKPYLLSGELFWNLGLGKPKGLPPYPQMTLGNLLFSAQVLTGEAGKDAANLLAKLWGMRDEWAGAWAKKAGKEYEYRLKQWARAIEEFQNAGRVSPAALSTEVRTRVLLELVRDQVELDELERLASPLSLDALFKQLTRAGDFVWDEELTADFDKGRFWFLYRQPS